MKNRKYFWTSNPHLENEIDAYFRMLEDYNQREFNGSISILLLGSMSRGEASWKSINGIDTIVSDIEFMTQVPSNFDKYDRLEEVFEEVKAQCFPDQNSSLFHIDTGIGTGGYDLSNLERKLITFDANAFAYCVVGQDTKETLPIVTYNNINMQDIWEVLIHRVFSALYWGYPLKSKGKTEEYRYNLAKNSLDLMTVLLVNNKQLISGFANRLEAIRRLDIDVRIQNYFEYCLSIKFGTECNYTYTISEMEHMFISILKQQDKDFRHPLRNYVRNFKYILRRKAGMMKRGLRIKHLPCTQKKHLHKLIFLFEQQQKLTPVNIADNYVLNGYPE